MVPIISFRNGKSDSFKKICKFNRFFDFRVNWEENSLHLKSTDNSEELIYDDSLTNSPKYILNDRQSYIIVYTCIMVFGTIFYVSHSFSFFKMCLRVSINLHDMLYQGITRAKMTFFNNNPSGRILNRFSGDIENVDSVLPHTLEDVIDVSIFRCIDFILCHFSTIFLEYNFSACWRS